MLPEPTRLLTHINSVAGSDSTSSALSYTFYHILGHPEAYEVLTAEIREAFPRRRYGTDELPPTYADLGRLPYLQAVIKESLRLTPPATINLPRYVPEGGRVVAGTFFPAKVSAYWFCKSTTADTTRF